MLQVAHSSKPLLPTTEEDEAKLYGWVKDLLPEVSQATGAWSTRQTALNGSIGRANMHKWITILLTQAFPSLLGHWVNEEFFDTTPLILPNKTTKKGKKNSKTET
jgi:hypothetical protein